MSTAWPRRLRTVLAACLLLGLVTGPCLPGAGTRAAGRRRSGTRRQARLPRGRRQHRPEHQRRPDPHAEPGGGRPPARLCHHHRHRVGWQRAGDFGTTKGFVYSANPTTGALNWTASVKSTGAFNPAAPPSVPMVSDDGAVYVADDGGALWQIDNRGGARRGPARTSSTTRAARPSRRHPRSGPTTPSTWATERACSTP